MTNAPRALPESAAEAKRLAVQTEVDARRAGLRGDKSSAYSETLKRCLAAIDALAAPQEPASPVAPSDKQINEAIASMPVWQILGERAVVGPDLHDFARKVLALTAQPSAQEPAQSLPTADVWERAAQICEAGIDGTGEQYSDGCRNCAALIRDEGKRLKASPQPPHAEPVAQERERCAAMAEAWAGMMESGAGDYPKGRRFHQLAEKIRSGDPVPSWAGKFARSGAAEAPGPNEPKESAHPSEAREALAGWTFTIEGDTAMVISPDDGPGFLTVHGESRNLSERLLYEIARAALSKGAGS